MWGCKRNAILLLTGIEPPPPYLKNKVKRKFGDLGTGFAGFSFWY